MIRPDEWSRIYELTAGGAAIVIMAIQVLQLQNFHLSSRNRDTNSFAV